MNSGAYLLILLLFLASCQERVSTEKSLTALKPEPFPRMQEMTTRESRPLAATWLVKTEHRFLYLGPAHDTLVLQYNLTGHVFPPPVPGKKWHPSVISLGPYVLTEEHLARADNWKSGGHGSRIYLSVDTTQRIRATDEYNADLRVDTVSYWFEAYPVLVRNLEPDTILIGSGDYIPLELQAQDRKSQWRTIEEPFSYFCGTGLSAIMLPPRQVAITAVMIPHGPFRTNLRLRLGNTYSAVFKGNIHPRQFDSNFDSSGEYQAAYLREHPSGRTVIRIRLDE